MRVTPASFTVKLKAISAAFAIVSFGAPQMVLAADSQSASAGVHVSSIESPVAQVAHLPVIHVGNFEQVSPNLMRGGAPSARALKELKSAGVKTILNLRGAGGASVKEERAAKDIGLNYYNFPMGYSEPDLSKVSNILDIIRDPAKQPVYIHCLQGADRTGMIVGIHRVICDGWKFDKAYSEMRGHHFKPFLIPMRKTVQAFASGKYTYVERQGVSIAGVSSASASAKQLTEDKPL